MRISIVTVCAPACERGQLCALCRCQTVPLVSKTFLQNHLDFRPRRKQWGLHGPGSVTASMVQWLLHVADDVCHPGWLGWHDRPGSTGSPPIICGFIMANLRGGGGQLLSSLLQYLGGVTEMEVSPDIVHGNFGAEFLQRSAGFQSLQVDRPACFLAHAHPIQMTEYAIYLATMRGFMGIYRWI